MTKQVDPAFRPDERPHLPCWGISPDGSHWHPMGPYPAPEESPPEIAEEEKLEEP